MVIIGLALAVVFHLFLLIPPLPVPLLVLLTVIPASSLLHQFDFLQEVSHQPREVPDPAELVKVTDGDDSRGGVPQYDGVAGEKVLSSAGHHLLSIVQRVPGLGGRPLLLSDVEDAGGLHLERNPGSQELRPHQQVRILSVELGQVGGADWEEPLVHQENHDGGDDGDGGGDDGDDDNNTLSRCYH